uniref:Immunoglobulin domain-containing protein n=1 Tax=Sphaeramia orbicularis TaxID=375764 RepID=A0A673CD64_9TELE
MIVVAGIHSISTVSKVTVEEGGSITIPCFYELMYTDHVKYLCKGRRWRSCSYEIKTDWKNSTKYSISDNKNQRLYSISDNKNQRMVTFIINDLKTKDTNYYWCNMEIKQGPDDGKYFHVRVTGKGKSFEFTTVQMGSNVEKRGGRIVVYQITIDCHYRGSKQIKWCRTGVKGPTSCIKDSGKIDETMVTIMRNTPGVITVTMSELRERSSGWYWCTDEDLQIQEPTTEQTGTHRLVRFKPVCFIDSFI